MQVEKTFQWNEADRDGVYRVKNERNKKTALMISCSSVSPKGGGKQICPPFHNTNLFDVVSVYFDV